MIKILNSEFSCPENSILYKLEKNKMTKCIEFGNKKPLIIYFDIKTFNSEFPQKEKFSKMIKHLYENYNILPGSEGLENNIKYFIFMVDNIKDAKLSIDNYIFKNTELFETNYIESLEEIGIRNEKLLKKYY